MERKIVGLGEILWDMLPEGKKLGGAPSNFAYHAGQFGFPSLAVSAIGQDSLADETIEALKEKRLDFLLATVPYPTGTVQVTLDNNGVPTYDIKENVAWDNIPFTDQMKAVARNCRAVCFGSLAQRNAVSRNTIRQFLSSAPDDCLKIFDINMRQNFYTREVLQESITACDILKINDEELIQLGRMLGYAGLDVSRVCRHIVGRYNLDMLVLTCGTDGSYVFTPDEMSFQPTPKVDVADTIGAGDSFTGAFCSAILSGAPAEEAHRLAVRVSAFVCTQPGAMPELPAQLTSSLNQQP